MALPIACYVAVWKSVNHCCVGAESVRILYIHVCFESELAIMLHALHIQYIGWAVMACIHNVTDANLGVQIFNATTLVRDILYMLCVRACDYVTCTAHTVFRVGLGMGRYGTVLRVLRGPT